MGTPGSVPKSAGRQCGPLGAVMLPLLQSASVLQSHFMLESQSVAALHVAPPPGRSSRQHTPPLQSFGLSQVSATKLQPWKFVHDPLREEIESRQQTWGDSQ